MSTYIQVTVHADNENISTPIFVTDEIFIKIILLDCQFFIETIKKISHTYFEKKVNININLPLTSEPSHSFLDTTRIVCNLFIIDVV